VFKVFPSSSEAGVVAEMGLFAFGGVVPGRVEAVLGPSSHSSHILLFISIRHGFVRYRLGVGLAQERFL